MLGISRGTLRTALHRLEETGEIVRRQGSGTFVGRVPVPSQLDERLERLEPYSSLAKRRGVELTATELRIDERPVGREVGDLLELDPATPVTTVFRVLEADGQPAAVMFDVPHPGVRLPNRDRFQRMLESGQMVLDILIETGLAVAFARTHVIPCLITPREQIGKALQVRRTTAALELEEVMYTGNGEPVAYSRDLFAQGALDVRVMRFLDATSPVPVGSAGRGRRGRAATPPAQAPRKRARSPQLQG
jgi:DNA-binding GntR family transcriptional regulator